MSAIPSKLARAAAAQTWPDVQRQTSEHVTMEDVNDSVRRYNPTFAANLGGECRDCGDPIPAPASGSKYHNLCGVCLRHYV